MSERFRYVTDAKRFNVNSPHIDIPCASIRACTGNGGKMCDEKVLIFFADEAAEKFNDWAKGTRWTKAYIAQSKITDRWYMVLNLSEDVSPEHHSFLREAAKKAYISGNEVPIKSLYFTIRYEKGVVKPYLAGVFRFDTKEEPEEMISAKQQKVAYYSSGQELTAATKLSIKKIIFNGPATIVFWTDGGKTVVRYNDETETIDDREKAVFAACAKKLLGTNTTGSNYLDRIKPAFDAAQEEWAKRIVKKEQ